MTSKAGSTATHRCVWETYTVVGVTVQVRVHIDSNAANGVTKRCGSGKIRHVQTQFL